MPHTAATFCAALLDEWVRCGVRHAVVCPGSRSTPLTLALARDPRIDCHVHLDERSAGFVAVGIGLFSGLPAVVVTTSGTATTELHAAVAEAHHGQVPMILCTADRPPELHDVGAPQTIDQTHLFGSAVRFYAAPGVPDDAAASTWRSLACRAFLETTGVRPGPVQLNLSFREPLVGEPGPLPPGRPSGAPWRRRLATTAMIDPDAAASLSELCHGQRGVIVAGVGIDEPAELLALAELLRWPVLAEPRSGCRVPSPVVVAYNDSLLRHPRLAGELAPDVLLRFGPLPASKVTGQWLASGGARHILVDPSGCWPDPEHRAEVVIAAPAGALCRALAATQPQAAPHDWLARWRHAEDRAEAALSATLASEESATEPGVARSVVAQLSVGDVLVVSSSMPVRDVEWFAAARSGVRILANRGANGIDGVLSTAIGVAEVASTVADGGATWLLIGDLALLHDASALVGLATHGHRLRLRLVIVDNRGGGIFSFLPQATALDPTVFESFWGTPQSVDLVALATAHGLATRRTDRADGVADGLAWLAGQAGTAALVVTTDRAANVVVHDRLNRAVAAAVERR